MTPQIMLNELRLRFGGDPQWSPYIAQAERLCESQNLDLLTTLYDMMMGGFEPWTVGMEMEG